MQKIENNIDIINKLLYDDKKNIQFVVKWMRITFRIFVKHFKQYLRRIDANKKSNSKNDNKIERIKNIKILKEFNFGISKGNEWMQRKFIISFDAAIYRPSIKSIYL